MKKSKVEEFHYVKIDNQGRRLFCLQQNLVVLAWILFFKKDTLRPAVELHAGKFSIHFVVSRLWANYRLFKKNLIFLLVFARQKYARQISQAPLILPAFGQISVPVHKGYKVFDLRRETVTKVFDHDVEESSIVSEVEGLKKIAAFDFAPSIKRWNIAERWYEEDYINGVLDDPSQPLESRKVLEHFFCDLIHPMKSLILSEKLSSEKPWEYVNGLVKDMNANTLSNHALPDKEFFAIKSFLDSFVERLRTGRNFPVYLVFTHGDFCPANMLRTKDGMKIIDWEGAGYRSALFDFYSYFFYRPVCRNVPVKTVALEVKEALPIVISKLAEKDSDLAGSLMQWEDTYRWMYYIEQVCQEVKREATDANLDILDFILRYIRVFSCFEEMPAVNMEAGRESGKMSSQEFGSLS